MKKRGRPTKAKADRRSNVLRIVLTVAERTELDEYAKTKTLETSTWARSALLELARKKL